MTFAAGGGEIFNTATYTREGYLYFLVGSLAMVQPDSPAKGKVFAKTGSLGAGDFFNNRLRLPTKALGGVMETAKGRKLAFAIVASNALFADIDGVFAANDDVGKVAAIIQQQY